MEAPQGLPPQEGPPAEVPPRADRQYRGLIRPIGVGCCDLLFHLAIWTDVPPGADAADLSLLAAYWQWTRPVTAAAPASVASPAPAVALLEPEDQDSDRLRDRDRNRLARREHRGPAQVSAVTRMQRLRRAARIRRAVRDVRGDSVLDELEPRALPALQVLGA